MSQRWVVTGTSMVVEADDEHSAVERAQETSGWQWEAEPWSEIDTRPPCPNCGAPLNVNVAGFEPLESCTNARCDYRI